MIFLQHDQSWCMLIKTVAWTSVLTSLWPCRNTKQLNCRWCEEVCVLHTHTCTGNYLVVSEAPFWSFLRTVFGKKFRNSIGRIQSSCPKTWKSIRLLCQYNCSASALVSFSDFGTRSLILSFPDHHTRICNSHLVRCLTTWTQLPGRRDLGKLERGGEKIVKSWWNMRLKKRRHYGLILRRNG